METSLRDDVSCEEVYTDEDIREWRIAFFEYMGSQKPFDLIVKDKKIIMEDA